MRNKRLFLILVFILSFYKAFPAVFVVTSNADSGPGTLRDALTQAAANGSAEKDYINFNLPGSALADKTITLLSPLPNVSANIVIDGTTQPGANLNKGDAKINLTVDRYSYVIPLYWTGGLIIDGADDVEVYGLDINGFYDLQDNFPSSGSIINSGIITINAKNITIGAPNKGNYFENDDFLIYGGSTDYTQNDYPADIKIQSNYFGFAGLLSYVGMGVWIAGQNILFGGDDALDGNHIDGPMHFGGTNIQIIHNYLAVDGNGQPLINDQAQIVSGADSLIIRDNTSNYLSVDLEGAKNFEIYGNHDIGDKTSVTSALYFYGCTNGIVGSDDITKQNVFHGNNNTIELGNQNSNNIQVLKNSIICSAQAYNIYLDNSPIIIPKIKVLVNSDTEFSGTASANSTIYIYEDNTDCPICNPVVFDDKITADASGVWKITGNFKGKRLLANALLNQNSSEFTQPFISMFTDADAVNMPACGRNNGSIILDTAQNYLKNVLRLEWYNSSNQKIGDGFSIKDIGPGTYYAKAINGNCSVQSPSFYLYDVEPLIFDQNLIVTQPSCGKGGSITGLEAIAGAQHPAIYTWTDKNNTVVGNTTDLNNLAAGEYLFTLTDTISNCSINYGPIILKNAIGPNIDQSKQSIQPSACGQSTGSINNLIVTGTGTLKYIWWDSNQQTVGTDKDLLNQPAGAYKLQVTDDTQCGPIYTTDIVIPETNGITMDESKAQTTIAMCGLDNGSVTGIKAAGATKYVWSYGTNNTIVTTTPDLQNIPPGDYVLTASNNFGCSKISRSYHINQPAATIFPSYNGVIVSSCYKANNGSVTVSTDALVKSLRWVDSGNQNVGTQAALTGLAPGIYQLYLTDQNGCESYYASYTVDEVAELVATSPGLVINDQCGLNTGSIGAATITGGVPPYTYAWKDASGNTIGNAETIANLAAGTYSLNIAAMRCGILVIPYTIGEDLDVIPAPSVSNVALCSAGTAVIKINNAGASVNYRLYDNPSSPHFIDEQKGGSFKVNVTGNRSFYISQLNGTCESERTEVLVTVGLSAKDIVNIFTPNGDGINDYWKINSIESYPQASIEVFTRNGQLVFNSIGYSHPFDGTFNGKKLPAGVYYYAINLGTSCKILSGSLTIIR